MALGYGSEYQLLRFLGHHRKYLDNEILKSLNKKNVRLEWFDYPTDTTTSSLDKELEGIECFEKEPNYDFIKSEWKKFWPQKGKSQNWDGIFKINDEWYFVEAKAHKDEVKSSCGSSSEDSLTKIKNAFTQTIKKFNAQSTPDFWVSKENKAYQFVNRLAFIVFCEKIGIKARLVYINFINGYDKPGTHGKMSVPDENTWKEIWDEEYKMLGLSEETLQEVLFHVYIDCEK